MRNNFRSDLFEELKDQSSEKEAEELLEVAFELNNLSNIRRSYNFKKAKAREIASIKTNNSFFIVRVYRELLSFKLPWPSKPWRSGLDSSGKAGFARRINRRILIPAFAALVLLLGSSALALAQKSLPGEALYPFKRVTEDVIVTFNPVFKEEVFKRRVEENKIIIERKKVSDEEHKLEEDKKDEIEQRDHQDNINSINQIKTGTESSEKENKEDEKKQDEKKEENETRNSEVKGTEDKRVELNEERKRENDKKNNNQKEENKESERKEN